MRLTNFAKYAWGVLAYNLVVILWGAYVRATGSGAGCGSHWPLCNGEVIPRAQQVETMIEFTHRLTSGMAMLLVAGLLIWALRAYPKGHQVRTGAWLSAFFIITEALVGAGLVPWRRYSIVFSGINSTSPRSSARSPSQESCIGMPGGKGNASSSSGRVKAKVQPVKQLS